MNKIILALDTTNLEEAIKIAQKVKDKIFTVKLGLEFFNAHGKEGIREQRLAPDHFLNKGPHPGGAPKKHRGRPDFAEEV